MNSLTDQQLLLEYARRRSESAFAELVQRHVDFVYSAALRMVRDAHLAEDVTQGAFLALAQNAGQLKDRTILSGWLHRTAQFLSANAVRTDMRRRAREQEAATMNEMRANEQEAIWENVAPHLDTALGELGEADRDALLLRYFERKSAREMAQILGTSEEAAQKRVSRAVERLRDLFVKRGVAVGTSGLVGVISAHAVQAAPASLSSAVATAVFVSGVAVKTSAIHATAQAITMTTLQKTIIAAGLTIAISAGVYQTHQASRLRQQVQALRKQQTPLAREIQELRRERDDATNRLAAMGTESATKKNSPDVLRLRGEVGRLRQEKLNMSTNSALNKITANPETKKLLREQQKLGMGIIFKDLAERLKLAPELSGKLNDLLADHVMENIDLITTVLRDGTKPEVINLLFDEQEAALLNKVQALVGPDQATQFQDYTRTLCSHMTVQQFKGMLSGDNAAKEEKSSQLFHAMQEETQQTLANAGLPPDFQTVPILNFRNIASETEGEKNLMLMDGIYERTASRAASFLSTEDLEKFKQFRTKALANSRSALVMNREMMVPLGK